MVETERLPEGTVHLPVATAHDYVRRVFAAAGIGPEEATLVADVLVSADLRGIRSHGLARIGYFMVRMERGTINRTPNMRLEQGSDTTAVLDADDAIGIVAAARAMDAAIAMAERHGSGFVSVRDTSHFGYAGYWTMRAMRARCIGIAMASGGRRVTPTFGLESVFGTNPMSVAVPGFGQTVDFNLDMATSAVAVGKIETALREGRPVEPGWVADTGEPPGLDDNGVLTYASPLLPLGGEGDAAGGHKGYGLALMIELLAGAIAGSPLSERIAGAAGSERAAMGQFMGAIRVEGFRPADEVGATMAETFGLVRSVEKSPGHDRVFIHGEPESIAEERIRLEGIAVTPEMLTQLRKWSDHFELGFDL